ncbi:hypothetical protein ACNI3T_02190 [Christiangramia sp. ASW11-125]|uniref:hypothetical protein n=1 Tax=Christiangramia sp. ASW11-125 TaxID=3400701 RepID=UPI003AAD9066
MKKVLIIFLGVVIILIGLIYLSVSSSQKTFETCTISNLEELQRTNFRNHDSVLIAPSTLYEANLLKDLVQGSNYRDAWSEKVKFPIVFLDTLYGGMEIIKEGGGKQTHSLKLRSKNDIIYTLRSVTKDPEKIIPEIAEDLGLENIIVDGISAQHPYAAILAAELAQKLDILHTHPRMVFIPKQEVLGDFNKKFGNRLFLLEYETESKANWTSLKNVSEIIETKDLQKLKFESKAKILVDQDALIKVRLFDLLIGDWDRHAEQWGWVIQKSDRGNVATPVAGDRDNAFFYISGLIPSIITNKNVEPLVRPFEKEIDHMPGLVYPFDRYFLSNTSEDMFIKQANELQKSLSDEIIANAFEAWPEQIRKLNEKEIAEKLKSRREKLQEYATQFFQQIQEQGKLSEALKGSEDLELSSSQLACFDCDLEN